MSNITGWNIFQIVIFTLLAVLTYSRREFYADCAAPIHYFIIGTCVAFIVQIVTGKLIYNTSVLKSRTQFNITFAFFILLSPFLFYLFIQGAIWELKNGKYTPHCGLSDSFYVWAFIVLLILMACFHIIQVISFVLTKMVAYKQRKGLLKLREQLDRLDGEELNTFIGNLNSQEEGEQLIRHTGLSDFQLRQAKINSYGPTINAMLSYNDECYLCSRRFEVGEDVLEMPVCGHDFHVSCGSDWLKKSPVCPMCRKDVKKDLHDVPVQQGYQQGYQLGSQPGYQQQNYQPGYQPPVQSVI